jgi:hypothetical protein
MRLYLQRPHVQNPRFPIVDHLPFYHANNETTFPLTTTACTICSLLPPSQNGAVPRHLGRTTLSLSTDSSASKPPAKHNSCTMSPLPHHIHRLPDSTRPDSSRHIPFPLHLYHYHQYQTTYDQRPGEAQLINGPFWFSSMIASQHAFPSFVLPCPAHLLITFFYFLRFSFNPRFHFSQKGGTRLGGNMNMRRVCGNGRWSQKRLQQDWIGWDGTL